MKRIKSDAWELFLEERHRVPGWQWPLNLAVALHLAIFAGAIVLPDITARKPQLSDIVLVDLIDLGGLPGPAAPSTAALLPEAVLEPVQAVEAVTPLPANSPPVQLSPERVVKKTVAPSPEPEVAVQPQEPEPSSEVAVIEPETDLKTAVETAAQEELAVEEPTPSLAAQESVSLTPQQRKLAVENTAEEKKKAEAAQVAKLAEEKKKAEAAQAAKLAEEKKKAEAAQAAKLAEEKKKAEAVRQQRLAQERRQQAERAERARAAEVQRQRAEQERQQALAEARRIEQEAAQALAEAEEARKHLAQALQQNTAVRSVLAGSGTGSGGIRGGSGSGVISPTALHQYAALLDGKISSHWKVPELVKAKPDLTTQVLLTVRQNGSIENMKIERRSGDALFDQSVLRALQSAEPLPSFPALISQPALEVELNFTPKGLTL